jgi:hypothetical protein
MFSSRQISKAIHQYPRLQTLNLANVVIHASIHLYKWVNSVHHHSAVIRLSSNRNHTQISSAKLTRIPLM